MNKTEIIIELKELLDLGRISIDDFERLKKQVFIEPEKVSSELNTFKHSEFKENIKDNINIDSNLTTKCLNCGSTYSKKESECKICKNDLSDIADADKSIGYHRINEKKSKYIFPGLLIFLSVIIGFVYYSNKNKSNIKLIDNNKTITVTNNKLNNVTKTFPLPFLLKNGNKIFVDSITLKPISGNEYEDLKLFSNGLSAAKKNGLWGYVNINEKVIIPFIYKNAFDFKDNIAIASNISNKKGIINNKGIEVIPFIYSGFRDLKNGMRLGYRYDENFKKKWDLINTIDLKAISLNSEAQLDPSESLLAIKRNNKWGFIDKNGNVIIEFNFDDVFHFSEGLARVKLNDNWVVIDKNGNVLFGGVTKYLFFDFHEGLIVMERDGKWGFLDKNGNEKIIAKFDAVDNFKNGFAKVKINNESALIDKNGDVVLQMKGIEIAGDYCEGLIKVERNRKFGFIDLRGKEIVQIEYDGAENFFNGLAIVWKNGRYGLINKKGEVVIPLEYNQLFFDNNYLQVYKGNTMFYSDLKGNLLKEN